ncbi:MAG: tetratricopeptide repeat protein, partial [Solirubrobacterales bacterium]|nr:tetratricopeptide repeat protein [Solirubrobacterales bacterium]
MGAAFEQAVEHFEAGRLRRAESACRAALAEEPGDPRALALLARVLARTGNAALAAMLLERALAAAPERAELRLALARLLLQTGDPAGALAQLDAVLEAEPSAPARVQRGLALRELGREDEALADVRAAADAAGEDAHAWFEVADALALLDRTQDARDALARAVALDPATASRHAELAQGLRAGG